MKPMFVFDLLLGPAFRLASFTNTDQSAVERSEADPFTRNLSIKASCSIHPNGNRMGRKLYHNDMSGRNAFSNTPLQATLHRPGANLDLLDCGLAGTMLQRTLQNFTVAGALCDLGSTLLYV